jgi:phosphoglycolate phosphatase-like HAD superfamily hydrolase
VFDGAELTEIPALLERPPIDPVGAGDSFLAGVAAGISCGASPVEAAWLGGLASGVTMHKLFAAGTASAEEILQLARDPDYRYSPDVAEAPWSARYHGETEIEVVTSFPSSNREFRHVVFDHDGTISTLRQGWNHIMQNVMMECVLGSSRAEVPPERQQRLAERVATYINDTTGVQTIIQMQGLERMVRETGYVPEEQILSPAGYKEIYNRHLMESVDRRLAAFREGRYGVEDLTIKGAVAFLDRLAAVEGLTLYLASGTDASDVRAEAEALGYAASFSGGIFGSVGDPENDPKKLVMQQILAKTGAEGRVVVFGDGPVELREAAKRGGYAVGVVSDEVRRYGINPAKRERLVLAGADILIPDFSWADQILAILFGR